ncbi:MAG: alanine racemase, partial [Actinobacteria bacterium]|nr:alanine racemase [Actinomycetota bacterium]
MAGAGVGSISRRPAWAEIDLSAIRHNAAALAARVAPAQLCAVVKAGGYGHGPVEVARAALDGGAEWLAVALVEEGATLRAAGVTAPVLLLSEPAPEAMTDVVAMRLVPTLYTPGGVEAMAAAAAQCGSGEPVPVHVKVDTGMHRVGASHIEAIRLAVAVEERAELQLEGLWSHFAVADVPADPFTAIQARRFQVTVDELAGVGIRPPLLHLSNSAAALAHPQWRHQLVRCGIALYGVPPSRALEAAGELEPALSLRARVSYVKELEAGEAISYGLQYRLGRRSLVATVPIGYGDGVPWRLGVSGGEVLIGGRRRPIAGRVT